MLLAAHRFRPDIYSLPEMPSLELKGRDGDQSIDARHQAISPHVERQPFGSCDAADR